MAPETLKLSKKVPEIVSEVFKRFYKVRLLPLNPDYVVLYFSHAVFYTEISKLKHTRVSILYKEFNQTINTLDYLLS